MQSAGGRRAYGDVFYGSAKAAHLMPFEVGKYHNEIIINYSGEPTISSFKCAPPVTRRLIGRL